MTSVGKAAHYKGRVGIIVKEAGEFYTVLDNETKRQWAVKNDDPELVIRATLGQMVATNPSILKMIEAFVKNTSKSNLKARDVVEYLTMNGVSSIEAEQAVYQYWTHNKSKNFEEEHGFSDEQSQARAMQSQIKPEMKGVADYWDGMSTQERQQIAETISDRIGQDASGLANMPYNKMPSWARQHIDMQVRMVHSYSKQPDLTEGGMGFGGTEQELLRADPATKAKERYGIYLHSGEHVRSFNDRAIADAASEQIHTIGKRPNKLVDHKTGKEMHDTNNLFGHVKAEDNRRRCPFCESARFDTEDQREAHFRKEHPDRVKADIADAVREAAVAAGNQAIGAPVLHKKPVPKRKEDIVTSLSTVEETIKQMTDNIDDAKPEVVKVSKTVTAKAQGITKEQYVLTIIRNAVTTNPAMKYDEGWMIAVKNGLEDGNMIQKVLARAGISKQSVDELLKYFEDAACTIPMTSITYGSVPVGVSKSISIFVKSIVPFPLNLEPLPELHKDIQVEYPKVLKGGDVVETKWTLTPTEPFKSPEDGLPAGFDVSY